MESADMKRQQATWTDLVFLGGLILFFAVVTVVGGIAGNVLQTVCGGGMAAACLALLISLIRGGLRPETRFERFETRLLLRSMVSFFGGGAVLLLINTFVPLTDNPLPLLVLIVVWLGVTGYFAWQVRGRWEGITRYKRRVGYKDEEG